jgi:1-deoxy-D-xylulose-5-phosphate synthase
MNEIELRNMLFTAQLETTQTSMSIRYPRGQGVTPDWKQPFEEIKIGKSRCIQEGKTNNQANKIAILSFGHIGNTVINACKILSEKDIFPAHYDMRFAKPLDTELLDTIIYENINNDKKNNITTIITIEDGCKIGGFGSAVLEYMASKNNFSDTNKISNIKVICLGIPDEFIEHGEPEELYALCGLDALSLVKICTEINQVLQN